MKTHRNNFRASILGLLGVGLTLCLSFCDAPQPEPLCADEMQDGEESDVDCGGDLLICARCPDGGGCNAASDCESNNCQDSFCVSLCDDGILNGEETWIDCGGSMCPKCENGFDCQVDSDCQSNYCNDGSCDVPP